MKKYIDLFITMLKIGLFTFGGGYAMIALLENEFVSRRKWIKKMNFSTWWLSPNQHRNRLQSMQLLILATEYFVLEVLLLQLSAYAFRPLQSYM